MPSWRRWTHWEECSYHHGWWGDTFVWFALDNIEFLESTPCGMNTLHGTALAVYQSAAPDKLPMISPICIDRPGRFAGRTKEWCFKLCMACDDDIRNSLESLGHRDLSEEEYDQLEQFVCQLPLPPTICSLTLHIQRAHYVAMIWRKAGKSHPRLPSPVDCGWKRGCKRTCSCRNNNLSCTEVCGCVNFSCHNLTKSDDLTLVMRDMDGDEWFDDETAYNYITCVSIIDIVCSD